MERQSFETLAQSANFANVILTNYNRGSPSIPQDVAEKYYGEALEVQRILYEKHGYISMIRTPVRLENKIKK